MEAERLLVLLLAGCHGGSPPLVSTRCLDAPPPGAVWVRPGADGDGSADAPLGSIDDALAAAPAGAIALWPGYYAEVPALGAAQDGLWLGAPCGDVTLTPGKRGATLDIQDAAVELVGLHLDGGEPGLYVEDASVRARGLIVEHAVDVGIQGHGAASIDLTDTVIMDTVLAEDAEGNPVDGYGIYLEDSSTLTATDLTVARTWSGAISAHGKGSSVQVTGLDVDETQRPTDSAAAPALAFGDGANASIEFARLNNSVGIHVASSGSSKQTTLRFVDVELGPVVPHAVDDGDPNTLELPSEQGLGLTGDATVEIVRLTSRGPAYPVGLYPSSRMEATISGLDLELDSALGVGLTVATGASATVEDVHIRGRFLFGVAAIGGDLVIAEPTIEATTVGGDNQSVGLGVTDGGTLVVTGGEVTGAMAFGAMASTDGELSLDGTHIWALQAVEAEEGSAANALTATLGGSIDATGVTLEQIPGVALAARSGGRVKVTGDSVIRDLEGTGVYSGYAGMILSSAGDEATTLLVRDTTVEDILGSGFVASGPETLIELEDVTISAMSTPYPDLNEGSSALAAYAGAEIVATDVVIRGVQGNGVFVDTTDGYDPDDATSASHLLLTNVDISEVSGVAGAPASGASAQNRGVIDWYGGDVYDIDGPGVYVVDATVVGSSLAITDVEFAGMAVQGGGIGWLDTSTIANVLPSGTYAGGMGVWASSLGYGYDVKLDSVGVSDVTLAGVVAVGDGRLSLSYGNYGDIDGVLFSGVETFGNGVIAVGLSASDTDDCDANTVGLCIDGTTFNSAVAPMVLLDNSGGWLCALNGGGGASEVVQTGCTTSVVATTCSDAPVTLDACVPDAWPAPGVEDLTITIAVPDVEIVEVEVPEP